MVTLPPRQQQHPPQGRRGERCARSAAVRDTRTPTGVPVVPGDTRVWPGVSRQRVVTGGSGSFFPSARWWLGRERRVVFVVFCLFLPDEERNVPASPWSCGWCLGINIGVCDVAVLLSPPRPLDAAFPPQTPPARAVATRGPRPMPWGSPKRSSSLMSPPIATPRSWARCFGFIQGVTRVCGVPSPMPRQGLPAAGRSPPA